MNWHGWARWWFTQTWIQTQRVSLVAVTPWGGWLQSQNQFPVLCNKDRNIQLTELLLSLSKWKYKTPDLEWLPRQRQSLWNPDVHCASLVTGEKPTHMSNNGREVNTCRYSHLQKYKTVLQKIFKDTARYEQNDNWDRLYGMRAIIVAKQHTWKEQILPQGVLGAEWR